MDSEVLALLVRAKDEASGEFKKIEGSLHTLTQKAGLAEKGFGALHSVLAGIGAGIGISIFQSLEGVIGRITSLIPELIGKGQSFAAEIEHLQKATGATAEAASHFAGQLEYLGIPLDAVTSKIGMMTKGIVAHEGELNKLGVSIRDSQGHFLDQITIMDRARSALSGMQDGVAKTKVAMDLFGRSGAGMIEWLGLSNTQVGLLNTKLDALGVTMSQAMVDNAKAARHEGNLLDLAMQGLGNTLTANVAPALTMAIDTMTNFVQEHGKQIAQFASEVVNFVLGMINALIGGNAPMVSFTSSIDAAANKTLTFNQALEDTTQKQHKAAGGAKAHTSALDEQIARIDKETASIKAMDAAQDVNYLKQMGHLSAQLGAQLSLLDAQEKAHALAETQASQAQALSDAQRALQDALAGTTDSKGVNTVDPRAVEAAQRAITATQQQQADLQTSIVNDARRTQIAGVQAYIDNVTKAETTWTSKKGLLAQLQKDQAILASQSEAAAKAGDIQKVADLALETEAVQTAIARAEQAKRNGDRMTDLDKHKAQLEELKKAAAAAGGSIGSSFKHGTEAAGTFMSNLVAGSIGGLGKIGDALTGPSPSIAAAMESARQAGMTFGTDMKAMIAGLIGAIQGLIGWIGDIKRGLDEIANSDVFKFLNKPINLSKIPAGAPGDWLSTARGGQLPPGFLPGTTAPSGAPPAGGDRGGGGVTWNVNINGAQDPKAVLQELQREVQRQGMTLGGATP